MILEYLQWNYRRLGNMECVDIMTQDKFYQTLQGEELDTRQLEPCIKVALPSGFCNHFFLCQEIYTSRHVSLVFQIIDGQEGHVNTGLPSPSASSPVIRIFPMLSLAEYNVRRTTYRRVQRKYYQSINEAQHILESHYFRATADAHSDDLERTN